MIIMIDNYDSFTWNLVQYFGQLGTKVQVHRNDKVTLQEIFEAGPAGLVISPGPSDPDRAGICMDLIGAALEKNVPLLGVCLGHQCMGQALGGRIVRNRPMHGKVSAVTHTGKGIFTGLPSPLNVTRYHSLIIDRDSLPGDLEITAETDDGTIMAVKHKTAPMEGVQFHPESIATAHGMKMLENFVGIL